MPQNAAMRAPGAAKVCAHCARILSHKMPVTLPYLALIEPRLTYMRVLSRAIAPIYLSAFERTNRGFAAPYFMVVHKIFLDVFLRNKYVIKLKGTLNNITIVNSIKTRNIHIIHYCNQKCRKQNHIRPASRKHNASVSAKITILTTS